MSNFITNSNAKTLKQRLPQLIIASKELKFLVSFFYFSGLKELYTSLKKKENISFKVLVGLDVDRTHYGLIEHGQTQTHFSNDALIKKFFQSIRNAINSDEFDNKEFYEQIQFFIDMIKNDRLLIKKTYEPNHAKLYLFKLENNPNRDCIFITGSSNFTRLGFSDQQEFNVEINNYGNKETEEYFDKLWELSLPITEEETKNKLIHVLEQETLIRKITPFEAYVYVLKAYLDTFQRKEISQRVQDVLEKNGYILYKYQLDAIKQAMSSIEENNGVIIADVVGIGKFVIACSVAFELKKRGIVIAPTGLLGDDTGTEGWNKYLEQFHLTGLGWRTFSASKLEDVEKYVSNVKDIQCIIVDEAHRFRNQNTKDYEYLKNICRGKKVILLSATPFNYKPEDIFSLLKLFITPKKSNITLSDDLEAKFLEYKTTFDKLSYIKKYWNSSDESKQIKSSDYYKSLFGREAFNLNNLKRRAYQLARQIKDTIQPVTIRRNRLDLNENPHYKNEGKELSYVENPIEWFYELSPEQSKFYDKVVNSYFAPSENKGIFKGAIYKPFIYKVGINNFNDLKFEESFEYVSQFNLYDFIRRLLVKRFESSFGAFKQSLENFSNITESVLSFVVKTDKYILDRKLLEKIHSLDIDEIEDELKKYSERITKGEYPKHHEIYEVNNFVDKELFIEHIKQDRQLFEKILADMRNLGLTRSDPKLDKLVLEVQKLREKEPQRKIIIFSEYRDTVKYLGPILQEKFQNRVLVVAGNLTKLITENIYKNFDVSYPAEKQANNYDILVSTDRISEGFNFNRAGIIINYDIPWNPVRIIQRLGRINRISKKVFNSLYVVNFFPTEQGADFISSREIAANKMFLIHNALGEDSKIFDIDEEPSASSLYQKLQQNPDILEQESFYTKVLKEFEEIKNKYPNLVESLKNLPHRLKVAKKHKEEGLFVVLKKGKLFIYYKDYTTGQLELRDLEEVIQNLKPFSHEEEAINLTERFWLEYEGIQNIQESGSKSIPQNSLQQKAINKLKTFLQNKLETEEIKNFIEMLLEDILEYGTLSEYTLRRIIEIDSQNYKEAVKSLMEELGADYLDKEKERTKNLNKEIIVAIENQSS